MRVTRYEQSCLLLELSGTRILIDPGAIPFAQNRKVEDLGDLDAILFTHEHNDHFDKTIAESLSGQIPVYVNESTAKQMQGSPKIVKDGDMLQIGSFRVRVVELPHCLMPDGNQGPQNVGYLINDMLLHPGDGIELQGFKVDNLALPVIGPDVSPRAAFKFARDVSAKTVIPIHYDIFGANPVVYAQVAERYSQPFKVVVLRAGESTQLG